ncbi:MAG: hypothetical protein CMD53_04555 [Gammaproteobacteria bacterium]|nr:hypothetical protein [Gammaproteobacteria bacterium]|tara:strand:+ start:2130 stop:3641 length:1512 start_codon:yes stop_codon:yes gene_type:complete
MNATINKEMDNQKEPIKILSAPLGVLLKISFAVSAAGALWAIFAKVPSQVDGLATMTPPGGLSGVSSPNEGTLIYVRDEKGRIIADAKGKQTLKAVTGFLNGMYDFDKTSKEYIENPSQELYSAFNQKIDNVIKITTASVFDEKELGKGGRAIFESNFPYLNKNEIVAYIYNPNRKVKVINAATDARSKLKSLRRTMDTYQRQKQSYNSRLLKLENAYKDVAKHFTINKDFETTLRKLNQAGYVPNNTYISGIASTANFSSLGEQYLQQGQQLTIESNNVDNKVNEAINEVVATVTDLRDSVNEYISESYVYMPQNGYLVEYSSVNLTNITKDTPIFEYTDSTPKLPEYTYAFFGAQQASQVFPGMKILSTPLGISRSQYGGIKGSVVSIDENPASQASINSVSGSSQVAKTFIESLNIPYRVLIKLEKNENVDISSCTKENRKETCYVWNSGAIPPFPVKIGNILTVQATTTEYTPLQLMIPRLRLFFGLETEAPGMKKASN